MESGSLTTFERVILPSAEHLTEGYIQAGLRTTYVGRKIYAFRTLKSTSDYAFRLAEEGADEGTLVVAEEQTTGRGRFGRSWHSPPGVGIWCSLVLRPRMFPWEAPRITMVAALAVARTIESVTGIPAVLKWPNDVYIHHRKVCGILTELSAEVESINFIVIGIGLNVNQLERHFPQQLADTATSLRIECGGEVSRVRLLRSLLNELELSYDHMMKDGFSSLINEIKSKSCSLQKDVSVRLHNRVYKGRALDIDEHGGLVLELSNGRIEHLITGDITITRE